MRDPGLAAVLSLIIPGAGQLYNGRILAGILWLIITPGMWIVREACSVGSATSLRLTLHTHTPGTSRYAPEPGVAYSPKVAEM
jgi:hypothetical protein